VKGFLTNVTGHLPADTLDIHPLIMRRNKFIGLMCVTTTAVVILLVAGCSSQVSKPEIVEVILSGDSIPVPCKARRGTGLNSAEPFSIRSVSVNGDLLDATILARAFSDDVPVRSTAQNQISWLEIKNGSIYIGADSEGYIKAFKLPGQWRELKIIYHCNGVRNGLREVQDQTELLVYRDSFAKIPATKQP
jgi:hypothetical protein